MKHSIWSFILALGLLAIILVGLQYMEVAMSAPAKEPPPVTVRQMSLEESVPPRDLQASQNSDNLESASQAQRSTNQSASLRRARQLGEEIPPANPTYPILEEFELLYGKFAAQYIQPGWVYMRIRVEHPDVHTSMGTLSNGVEIPNTSTSDVWYLLGKDGLLRASVSLMYDETGQLNQVSVYKDRVWHNLTIGESWPESGFPRIGFDGHFLNRARGALSEGGFLEQTETILDGRQVKLYSYEIMLDPPHVFPYHPQPVSVAQGRAYVDQESGAVLVSESVRITTKGEILISLRQTLLAIESVDTPPDEILAYLEQIR
jgi:hypothetical protein